jgi:hypothetical protein
VRHEVVLHRVEEDRNIVHAVKGRKANWIGNILRRNCFLKHDIEGQIEGRIEMKGRPGRRGKQLLDDLEEKRRYRKLKEDVLGRTVWRNGRGRGYGPVLRQTAEGMDGLTGYEVRQDLSALLSLKRGGDSAVCGDYLLGDADIWYCARQ